MKTLLTGGGGNFNSQSSAREQSQPFLGTKNLLVVLPFTKSLDSLIHRKSFSIKWGKVSKQKN